MLKHPGRLAAITAAAGIAVASAFVAVSSGEAAEAGTPATVVSKAVVVGTPTALVSKASGRCLTVLGSVVGNGPKAVVFDCNNGNGQKWTYTAAGELRVWSGSDVKCLDATTGAVGAQLVTWACHGGTNQKFTVADNGNIKSTKLGNCLDVKGGGNSPNNTPVLLWSCSTTAQHQVWTQTTTPTPPTGSTPVAINGQLKVCGVQVCNQYGKPIQLRGMSTHGIQWYWQCVNNASLDALAKDWKADVLRISMYVQEDGYETDPVGFTAKVNQAIKMVSDRGMYAVVDFHQLSPGDPNYNLANAKRFFTDIANANKDRNNIIYEIANEPNEVSWARVRDYANIMVPHVRAIDSNAIVLVGTHGWGSLGVSDGGNENDVINNQVNATNILYTFHFYAASHDDEYLNTLDRASSRIPMWVSEFGTQQASGDGGNNFGQSQKYIDLMKRKKISWTNWNYSDDERTGAVFTGGTCGGSDYGVNRLKEAGKWIRDRIVSPDDFPTS